MGIPSAKTKVSSQSDLGDWELPPAETLPAVLIGFVDLGTHDNSFNGETKKRHLIYLVWELTATPDSSGQNFLVGCEYTWSLSSQANLRPVIEAINGKPLVNGNDFDIASVVGKPCQLTLVEGETKAKKKFVQVSNVTAAGKYVNVPSHTRDLFGFTMECVDKDSMLIDVPDYTPRTFGEKVEDKIKRSYEYKALLESNVDIPF